LEIKKQKHNQRFQLLLSDEIVKAMEECFHKRIGLYESVNHMIRSYVIKGLRDDGFPPKLEAYGKRNMG